ERLSQPISDISSESENKGSREPETTEVKFEAVSERVSPKVIAKSTRIDWKFLIREMIESPEQSHFLDGQCQVQKLLGESEFGRVYKIQRKKSSKKIFVVKISLPLKSLSESLFEQFLSEEKAILNLQHPHLVEYRELGILEHQNEKFYYHILDYFSDITLQDYVAKQGFMTWEEIYPLTQQIADALFYIHRKGLVHRDLKPSNILYKEDEGQIQVIDFALMKFTSKNSKGLPLLSTGTASKNLHFLSPEQLGENQEIDKLSDLYTLGATLYFLLTGQNPYSLECPSNPVLFSQFMLQTLKKEPKAPFWTQKASQHIPEGAIDLINTLLAYDPRDRPSSAEAVLNHLAEDLG
ncbi:MAG: serine/threonine-protein kinase, partial [Planctomycetota bacterium]